MKWIYDGSFEGFLSLVHKSYISKTIPDAISTQDDSSSLFEECYTIQTQEAIASKVASSMSERFSKDTIERIFHAFLCDDSNPEKDILLYIRLGFKSINYLQDYAHPIVYAIHAYQRRLLSILHKMNAYLRFEELADNTLYAKIQPPCNVLPLMGRHFKKRLKNQPFIIHDTKRSLALLYQDEDFRLEHIYDYVEPTRSDKEDQFKALWKIFFERVAIKERINLKLQQAHIPLHYRKYMSEFMD